MSVSSITIDHSGKVEPKRGDGKHAERGDGRDLGELSWKPDLNAHVCLDCGYRQDRVLSIQAQRYQAAWCKSHVAADGSASVVISTDGSSVFADIARLPIRPKWTTDGTGSSLSAAIHAALDAWEAKP